VAGVIACAGLLLVIAGAHLVWQLHPWVTEGKAFALGKWQFGQFEFQVWQRKTEYLFEPFADGLFVRAGTNQWQVFCFDIQDSYSPRVKLVQKQGRIVVYRDGENRGMYDTATQTFLWHGQAYTPQGIGNSADPPGEWWLR
jgi:hypothetical protein